jgi:hypothetical protein
MKKAQVMIVLSSMLLITGAKAQLNQFKLSDYKLPVVERRLLDFDFNLYGMNLSNTHWEGNPYEKSTQNHFNNDIGLRYNYFQNNETTQRSHNIRADFRYSFNNQKEDGDLINKQSFITPQIFAELINRKYNDRNQFIEYNLDSRIFLNRLETYIDPDIFGVGMDFQLRTTILTAAVPLKIGHGRIEPVHDARQAIYIFEELGAIDRLSAPESDDEIIRFAQLISRLRNKRFFDSRLKTIEDLEEIDAYLRSEGYILQSDASYFATLADYWAFGNTPVRMSGRRLSLGFIPSVYYRKDAHESALNNSNVNDDITSGYSLYAGIDYTCEKPLNYTWQSSFFSHAYIGYSGETRKTGNSETEQNYRYPNLNLGISETIGYHPNTRTNATAGLNLQYINFFDGSNVEKNILSRSGSGFRATTSINVEYYFSPQLRLSVFHSMGYIWQNDDNYTGVDFAFRPWHTPFNNFPGGLVGFSYVTKGFSQAYGLRLLYSIF